MRLTRRQLLLGTGIGLGAYTLGIWPEQAPAHGPVLWTDEPYWLRPEPLLILGEDGLTTLTLQPDATVGKDVRIDALTPSTNIGTNIDCDAIIDSIGYARRGLLCFDLSSIPLGSTVSSATLTVYRRAISTADQINVHRITNGWIETDCSWDSRTQDPARGWSSAGGEYAATVYASATPTGSEVDGDPIAFDVTTLVQEWVDGTYPNSGFLLKKATETGASTGLGIWSSDYGTAAQRPKLVVEYTAASARYILGGNGGWCWFSDPRAIHYNGTTYIGYVNNNGDICIRAYNHMAPDHLQRGRAQNLDGD